MDMKDFKKYPELEIEFRANKKQTFAATEIAYITRYLKGDENIHTACFSIKNLQIVKLILNTEKNV